MKRRRNGTSPGSGRALHARRHRRWFRLRLATAPVAPRQPPSPCQLSAEPGLAAGGAVGAGPAGGALGPGWRCRVHGGLVDLLTRLWILKR